MTFTPLQLSAEQKIVNCVLRIDAVRSVHQNYGDRFIDADTSVELIAEIDVEILELKKLTGPRVHRGAGKMGL